MSVGMVGGALAGCTAVTGETELTEPTESHDDHSVRFAYDHENETLVRVYFNKRPDTPWQSVNEIPDSPAFHRLRIGTEQPGDVRLNTYRFRFKPAGDGSANIYLHPPALGHEDTFDTYRDADWTIIEAEYDDGTPVGTGFEILVYSNSENVNDSASIRADYELTLSGDGYLDGSFIAQDQTTIEIEQTE
jgi:hypothetical protein